MAWFIYVWDIDNERLIGPYETREAATERAREMIDNDEAEQAGIVQLPFEMV